MARRLALIVTVLLTACASGAVDPSASSDGVGAESTPADSYGDTSTEITDFSIDWPLPRDLGCVTGTSDDCAFCGDRCPGQDSETVQRSCIDGGCVLACREEAYDVNGDIDDGCEVSDDLPLHASEKEARSLGTLSDCAPAQTVHAKMPSDNGMHVGLPNERPNGRPDYYSVRLDDDAFCDLLGEVQVALEAMPATAEFRVTTEYYCDNASPTSPRVTSGKGGETVSNIPDTTCNPFGWGDDSGELVIRVEKMSGPHSAASYSLSVLP